LFPGVALRHAGLELCGRAGLQLRQHRADDAFDNSHHLAVVAHESELGVQRRVLVEVPRRVVRLGAEHRADLEDALEDAHQHLLVELRALREVRGATEVVNAENVGAAFGGSGHELGGEDFGEALGAQGLPEALDRDRR
jgi:hypothetical protein